MKNNQATISSPFLGRLFNEKIIKSIICYLIIQLIFPYAKFLITATSILLASYFKQIVYFFLHSLIWILSKTIYRIDTTGIENIPKKSGGIIVANHTSLLDALLIISSTKRTVRFVMHDKIFHAPVIGLLFKKLNMIPISSKKTKEGLDDFNYRCKKEIENGHLVCIFPEGEITRNGQLSIFKKGIEHLAKITQAPIIPLHMDNVIGTPLSFKPGTHHKYGFNFKTLRKKVFITIGTPIKELKSAFELRQIIRELELKNVAKRVKKLPTQEAIYCVKSQLFKNTEDIVKNGNLTLNNLIINAPNYKVKDLIGSDIILTGSKQGSIGRPIPGVLAKIVSESGQELLTNETGYLYIKHCFTNQSEWENTGRKGQIDEAGFITLSI